MVRVFSNDDVAELLDIGACIDAVEAAYAEVGAGRGASTGRTDLMVPTAPPAKYHAFKAMAGGLTDAGVQAVRLDSDLRHWPEKDGTVRQEKVTKAQDDRLRIGKENGLVVLYSVENGEPLAMLPDGEIQRRRVGATNGLAARAVGPAEVETLGIVGSGYQARTTLLALEAACEPAETLVYSPTAAHRREFAEEMGPAVAGEVRAVGSARAAVEPADVAQAVTTALAPVVEDEWVGPGMHVGGTITAEVDPATVERADAVLVNSTTHRGPEHVIVDGPEIPVDLDEAGYPALPDDAIDLADLVAGTVAYERAPDDLTCFLNNVGLGVQFAALGALLLETADEGVGETIPTEWFLQDVPQR